MPMRYFKKSCIFFFENSDFKRTANKRSVSSLPEVSSPMLFHYLKQFGDFAIFRMHFSGIRKDLETFSGEKKRYWTAYPRPYVELRFPVFIGILAILRLFSSLFARISGSRGVSRHNITLISLIRDKTTLFRRMMITLATLDI